MRKHCGVDPGLANNYHNCPVLLIDIRNPPLISLAIATRHSLALKLRNARFRLLLVIKTGNEKSLLAQKSN